jgi:predicted amidohydrolase YtcJ
MKLNTFCLLSLGAFTITTALSQPAETILNHGKIISANDKESIYQSMAIREGKIIALGSLTELKVWQGPNTQVIDLKGKTVIPGLIDSHIHAIRAALSYSTEVHWFGLPTIEAALNRLKQAASSAKPGEWLVVAGGWTEENLRKDDAQHKKS